jgi:hypothetical protein
MKRLRSVVAVVFMASVLALPTLAGEGSWTGWITDEQCGAKGAKADHKACALKCVADGGKLVFYNSKDKKIYRIDNQDLAKEHIGHEVKVKGEADGDSIKVASIDMAEKQ